MKNLSAVSNNKDVATKEYADSTNKIESIKVNGTAQTISNKAVDIPVPTNIDTNNLYIGGIKVIWYEQ